MEHLKMSKMPLDDMKNMHVMESNSMTAESKMPEIHVNIEKKGVENSVSPVSDKPLRVEKNEWYNG